MQDSFLQAMEIALGENVDRLSHKTGHFAKLFAHGKKSSVGNEKKRLGIFHVFHHKQHNLLGLPNFVKVLKMNCS